MGKYKQWLHHQEVGRRLREQIATHEQERERVQRMAPSHPTTLPDTNNPLVRALLDYTGRGGTLGRAVSGRIAGSPTGGSDSDPQPRQPEGYASAPVTALPTAPFTSSGAPNVQASATPAASADPLVAQLAAQAAQTPADPLAAMQALAQAQARDTEPHAAVQPADQPAETSSAPEGATTGDWWQSFRANR